MSLSFRRYGVMDFVEGDPDRPQISGMLPGPNDTLPFSPEERPNTSGIKTCTPPGPGSAKDKMTLHVGDTKIEMEPRKMSITTFRFATGMPPEPTDPLPEKVPTFTSAPGSEQTADMQSPQSQQNADKLFYPSAKLSIDLGQVALPPEKHLGVIYEITLSMHAELTADSKDSMTEIDYQAAENKIKMNLKANVADLFEHVTIVGIDPEKGTMQINVENIGTLTSTSFALKENQVYAEFTDHGIKTTYGDWEFSGSATLNLTVTIIPGPPKQSKDSVYQEVKQHLEDNLLIGLIVIEPLSFGSSLKTHHAAIEQKPIAPPSSLRDKIIAATLVVTMMLLAPAGV